MRSFLTVACLLVALAMLVPGCSARASNGPPPPAVKIQLGGGNPPTTVKILERAYFGVCSNPSGKAPACEDSVMRWKLIGNPLGSDQQVKIEDAPFHVPCFSSSIPITFTSGGSDTQESGSADPACTWSKFGVYWPYVVRLIEVDENGDEVDEIDSTDPGGIIFP